MDIIRKPIQIILAVVVVATSMVVTAGASPAGANAEYDQPVILIHGFSLSGSHNCETYFGDLRDYLEWKDREVTTFGFYADNDEDSCDEQFMDATTDTKLQDIAKEFRDRILAEFGDQTVDIVAHSMGGIVTRIMLDRWGSDLWVDDVVTLGTPHNGTVPVPGNQAALCPEWTNNFEQCEQMEHQSALLRSLEHNPQSKVPTEWTLIGTYNDQVIGPHTSIQMRRAGTDNDMSISKKELSRPKVEKYQYGIHARTADSCPGAWSLVDHGALHNNVGVWDCEWEWFSYDADPIQRPFYRTRMAIKY